MCVTVSTRASAVAPVAAVQHQPVHCKPAQLEAGLLVSGLWNSLLNGQHGLRVHCICDGAWGTVIDTQRTESASQEHRHAHELGP